MLRGASTGADAVGGTDASMSHTMVAVDERASSGADPSPDQAVDLESGATADAVSLAAAPEGAGLPRGDPGHAVPLALPFLGAADGDAPQGQVAHLATAAEAGNTTGPSEAFGSARSDNFGTARSDAFDARDTTARGSVSSSASPLVPTAPPARVELAPAGDSADSASGTVRSPRPSVSDDGALTRTTEPEMATVRIRSLTQQQVSGAQQHGYPSPWTLTCQ